MREVAKGADLLAILVPHRVVVEELKAHENKTKEGMRNPRIVTFQLYRNPYAASLRTGNSDSTSEFEAAG